MAEELTVPLLVAARAAESPDATAIVAGDHTLRYGEMDARANLLAELLSARGVGPDVVVGLCFDRSPAHIVAALAVMKAGGAFLPLDPTYPRDRLTFMLEDAGSPVLVSDPRFETLLPEGPWQTVSVDRDAMSLAPGVHRPPKCRVAKHDLVYVIYTSGSTGRPKGVEITHGGLLNLIAWHQQAFSVAPSDRATQISSPAFDGAVWEVWPYLAAGASIHIPDEETRRDAVRLRDWVVDRGITISFMPTPLAEAAIAQTWPARSALRALLTGADTLHSHPPATLPFTLVNNYGPTETTVVATSGVVPPESLTASIPSIGRPILNTQIHILDEAMRPVATGEAGELFIGGRGVARGYRNRPDLTAERFVPDPFSTVPYARLYRTGDLVRARPDGEIEFIGRIDQQVKIRGFRIELGEVEAVLMEHRGLTQAAAVAPEGPSGARTLVAYVVGTQGSTPPPEEVRRFLAMRLPDYMWPARVIALERLPLTPNGKVDRAALAGMAVDGGDRNATLDAPRTLIQGQLTAIVAALLKLDRVGVDENFFALGGHSLLGAQLIARINEVFGIALPLRTVFDCPTVTELSAEIERCVLEKLDAMTDEQVGPLHEPEREARSQVWTR